MFLVYIHTPEVLPVGDTRKFVLEKQLVGTLEFVEPIEFFDDWQDLGLDDDALRRFQIALMENPEAGDLIPGTNGARKVRFAGKNLGKRGGTRVIYLYLADRSSIALLIAYGKKVQDDLTTEDKRLLKDLVTEIKTIIPIKRKRNAKK